MKVLVTGGAGYIGAVLCEALIAAGHEPIVLDRFFWGRGPLEGMNVATIAGDVRELQDAWLDGIEAVCHLGGLSNDPTAEYNPAANREMNLVATQALVAACKRRKIKRFTFASSASIYDSDASSKDFERSPIMCDETTQTQPRGAYSITKREAEIAILQNVDADFSPVIFRQGTVYGYSPRMRFDLVVNTFIKDAIVRRKLFLHGGGWMWRPLVDVRDVCRAHVLGLESPLEKVAGEIFNVLEENYQIRQLAMLVAGSIAILRPGAHVELEEAPQPSIVRNYRMSNTKLTRTLGLTPSVTVLESIEDMLRRLPIDAPESFADPRYYNVRWMTLLEDVHREQSPYDSIY